MTDLDRTNPFSPADLELVQRSRTGQGITLVVELPTGELTAPLRPGHPLVVGREGADLVVPDPSLSRLHARFELTAGLVWLEDLGSTNGTRVNGDQIDRTWIARGDQIRLGGIPAAIRGAAAATGGRLCSHERFITLLDYEVARARTFGRPVALLMIGEVDAGAMGRLLGGLDEALRPVDQAALYGPTLLEVMLPEADQQQATDTARRLLEPGQRCGVAVFPDLAASANELIGVSVAAQRSANPERPVRLAPDRKTGPHRIVAGRDRPIIRSAAMKGVYETVRRVAPSNLPILIQGETGTGKELVARAIHEQSRRSSAPLCCLNCGAIPAQLVLSELFGHEKGAFTGAGQLHRGLFESAAGGSVFLDEIGELSAEAQVALLRVLETKRLTRVGGSKEIEADVRIIAATHRELERMCEEGAFRLDLLYRLNTMMIELPPLRERPEDVEALARHFLELANRDNERQIEGIAPEALSALRRHRWPGNVRELRNAVERAVVIARGQAVTLEDLPAALRVLGPSGTREVPALGPLPSGGAMEEGAPGLDAPASADAGGEGDASDFKERVQRFEAQLIAQTLRECDNNQSETSRRLRIPLRTLVNKLQLYGLAKR